MCKDTLRRGGGALTISKYQPLESWLSAHPADEAVLAFEEIEAILGLKLPRAAHTHRAWWSNNPSNNVMTRAWLAAGYRSARVDMEGRRLVFRRAGSGPAVDGVRPARGPAPAAPLLERLWASLGGTVRTPEGVDLTDPVGDAWDADPR